MNTDEKLSSEKLVTPIHLPIDIDLCVCACVYYLLAMLQSMWDLSSPTRDQTCNFCIGSVES